MPRLALTICIVAGFVAFHVTIASAQPLFHVTNLGKLETGSDESEATGINSVGQVVGTTGKPLVDARAFIWSPDSPNGTTGTMHDLGALLTGNGQSAASRINSIGQVTGQSNTAGGNHAFLWTPSVSNGSVGLMTDLGDLPGDIESSYGHGINDLGQVAGQSRPAEGNRAFLWTPTTPNGSTGSMVSLGELSGGLNQSFGYDINERGQVTGESGGAAGVHAFLWTPDELNGSTGMMVDLGDLPGGGTHSVGRSINDQGVISGHGEVASTGGHALRWTPDSPNGSTGSLLDLGAFGTTTALNIGRGVNNLGWIVGSNASTVTHAFLWTEEFGMLDLNSLVDSSGAAWVLNLARAVNDTGQIVGYGLYDPDGAGGVAPVQRAFLLTPVPEPGATFLLLIPVLMSSQRRRK